MRPRAILPPDRNRRVSYARSRMVQIERHIINLLQLKTVPRTIDITGVEVGCIDTHQRFGEKSEPDTLGIREFSPADIGLVTMFLGKHIRDVLFIDRTLVLQAG